MAQDEVGSGQVTQGLDCSIKNGYRAKTENMETSQGASTKW